MKARNLNMLKKGDVLLVALILAAVLAATVFFKYQGTGNQSGHKILVVKRDGKTIKRIDLDTVSVPVRITVQGKYREVILIEKGRARFEEASCPDRLCVNTGWLSKNGDTAVCLPNKTVLRIEGERSDVDGVTY